MGLLRPKGFSGVIFNTASRVLCAFSRAVTCIGAKRASMLIHTPLTNGHIPPVRGVTGLPGGMSGCGATCTSRGLPGVVGISGRSKVARWKAETTAVILVYYIGPKVPVAQMAGMFPLVLDSAEYSARSGTVPGPIGACHGTNQRRCNKHDNIKRSCACARP